LSILLALLGCLVLARWGDGGIGVANGASDIGKVGCSQSECPATGDQRTFLEYGFDFATFNNLKPRNAEVRSVIII